MAKLHIRNILLDIIKEEQSKQITSYDLVKVYPGVLTHSCSVH